MLEVINNASRAIKLAIQKNHLYCENSSPNLAGGKPTSKRSPGTPPRNANWLAISGRPTANAKVVPARYGPDNRAAAVPKKAPKRAEATIAIKKANQTGLPKLLRVRAAA